MRKFRGIKQAPFAKAIGVSVPTLWRIEHDYQTVERDKYMRAAKELGLGWNWERMTVIPPPEIPERLYEENREPDGESGIDPASLQWVDVPTFDIDLSATSWSHVPICELDTNDPRQRRIVETGHYRLRIIGDCMEPDYASGATIEFETLVIDRDPLMLNHDYALCRNDGTATFKKLIGKTEMEYELAAINQKSHPGSFKVPIDDIVRIGKVWKIIADAPPARAIKVVRPKSKRAG